MNEDTAWALAILAMADERDEESEIELAWAAGLFEGEGTATITRSYQRVYLALKLAMVDREPVARFAQAVKIGGVSGPYAWTAKDMKNRRPIWLWSATGAPALRLVETQAFMSHLGARRAARIAEIVALVEQNGPTLQEQRRSRTHCPHGHPYDAANTLVTPRGWRGCRACQRTRKAAARAAQKATQQ